SNSGTLTISNGVTLSSTATSGALTNYGTVIWAATAGNYVSGYGNAVIFNAGLWQITADDSMNNATSGTNTFINTGTIQKLGSTGVTTINWRFNSTGTINTAAGYLSCSAWMGINTLNGNARLYASPFSAPLTVSSNSSLDLVTGSDISSALTIAAG